MGIVTSANGMEISKCVADVEAETYMHQRTSHRRIAVGVNIMRQVSVKSALDTNFLLIADM